MAGLLGIFGFNEVLNVPEEHSDCHVVIDGSNLQYFCEKKYALSNLPDYEEAVRNLFQVLLDANITPHVFFDGPSKGDRYKWDRSRRRRHKRLEILVHQTSSSYKFEYPLPTSIQEIFRDVIHSLGIRSIQVSDKRDYTLEMVSHARYLNAFLISGNTKFFLEDIPRGFVCVDGRGVTMTEHSSRCILRTFKFKKFSQLIGLEKSPNRYAVIMWGVALFHQKTFNLFTDPFFNHEGPRAEHYPYGYRSWMGSLLTETCRKLPQLKLLQFFLEHTRSEAEEIIRGQLFAGERKEAMLLFEQSIAAQLIEPNDVFERLEGQIKNGEFCDEDLPQWFLRHLTVECKLIPGVMDILTNKCHHLMSSLEDFKKASVNRTTLRLRRIMYGILFAEMDINDNVRVTELDRVGDQLIETDRSPIWYLWSLGNRSETHTLPGLKKMACLPETERLKLFLLSMCFQDAWCRQLGSGNTVFVLAILRYWIVANEDVGKRDLLRVLLTVLAVEQKYSRPGHIFERPVTLKEHACSDLGIRFDPASVSNVQRSFACLHPLALLHNVTLFGRTLHRLFMQPLGVNADAIETITSEVVFFYVHKLTQRLDCEELEDLISRQMDEMSRRNFSEAVDSIWDEEALNKGRRIVRGFRGDDRRS